MRFAIATLAVAGLVAASHVQAAGRGTSGRVATSAGKSSATANRGYRASSSAARSAQPRRSLLEGSPTQPSPKVVEVIRERESSGPGWIGTAFLISMLSRHDLSSADRSWIQGRIDALRADGNDGDEEELLDVVAPPVSFSFDGLHPKFAVGEKVSVKVSAKSKGAAVPVTCSVNGGVPTQPGLQALVTLEPSAPGSALLTCDAAGHQSRRVLRITPAGDKSEGWS